MFLRLRTNLTLWYSLVLAGALVLFGITLYFFVQQTVFSSVQHDLSTSVNIAVSQWQHHFYDTTPCTYSAAANQPQPPRLNADRFRAPYLSACFTAQATLIRGSVHGDNGQVPTAFLKNALIQRALQTTDGQATDIITSGSDPIYRYAVVVHSLQNNGVLGVVQIGESVQAQETTLQTLLFFLVVIGVLTLVAAAFGGLFLSNRALAPARLAMERQRRFIADASHELRTPLTLMRADAEVLLRSREHFDTEDAALLEDIVAEATHMTTLATSMLSLARLDAGHQHQEHDVVDLSTIAAHIVQRAEALAGQHNITLHLYNATPALVIGDATLLEQATLVLLDNAIKYNSPDGSVTIKTYVEDDQAKLAIQDTGIGIPNEHLPYLGERFYRVDKARSREAGGTGLGLSIARSIINAHNGMIDLYSVMGEGTQVTLALPLARFVG